MRTLFSAGLAGALLLTSSNAENLLENGSFEHPKITGRILATKGGNPSLGNEKTSWTSLIDEPESEKGTLTTGLTDEIAQEGKQSLYVDFEKLTALGSQIILSSDLLPVQANQPYRISAWGRIDRERPISMDERRPQLLVEVEFYAADQETQVGNTEYRVQLIPGSFVPGLGIKLVFISSKWNEYFTQVKSPTDAAFAKVVFKISAPRENGETDGVLFLDNLMVNGLRGSVPLTDKESATEEEPEASAIEPAGAATPGNQAKSGNGR